MRKQTTKYPLRKIVRTYMKKVAEIDTTEVFMQYEVLECGHEMRPRQDCYGEYFAARRRCTQCPPKEKL